MIFFLSLYSLSSSSILFLSNDVDAAVRVTPSDWIELVNWQSQLNRVRMPSYSDFRLEMYFNGAGGLGTSAPGVVSNYHDHM